MLKVGFALSLAMLPAMASAAVVIYDSEAAMIAAGVVPAKRFTAPDPFTVCNDISCNVSPSYRVGPVTFTGSTYLALYDDYATYVGGSPRLTIATPAVHAAGFYFGAYYGETADVLVDGVTVATGLDVTQDIAFIGFTSDAPITSIAFAGRETDIMSGFLSAVPEPATWLQLIAGLGLVGLAQRRRRRAA